MVSTSACTSVPTSPSDSSTGRMSSSRWVTSAGRVSISFTTASTSFGSSVSASRRTDGAMAERRSEEHTSELQSRQYLVCRLLLEKTKHIEVTIRERATPASRQVTLTRSNGPPPASCRDPVKIPHNCRRANRTDVVTPKNDSYQLK